MAGSVNKVTLLGNLAADPEARSTKEGGRIVSFRLATSEVWRDRNTGERREKTEWHTVVIFDERLGERAEKYLRKGSRVFLEGALQTRKWTDQQGQDRYSTEVVLQRFRGELVLLDGAPAAEKAPPARERPAGPPARDRRDGWSTQNRDELNDEIPFLSFGIDAEPFLRKSRTMVV